MTPFALPDSVAAVRRIAFAALVAVLLVVVASAVIVLAGCDDHGPGKRLPCPPGVRLAQCTPPAGAAAVARGRGTP